MTVIAAHFASAPNPAARAQAAEADNHVQVPKVSGHSDSKHVGPQGITPRPGPVLRMDSISISLTQGEETGKLGELTPEEEKQVQELKARDKEVRQHEEAHARAGAPYTGQPSFDFQRGPDGQQYAVGGEVSIDTAPIAGDPEATIHKMEVVKRAASAPAEPSGQDRSVAAQADAQMQAARAELQEEAAEARQQEAERGSQAEEKLYPADFARSAPAYAHIAAVVAA